MYDLFVLENIILKKNWTEVEYKRVGLLKLDDIKTQEELELNFYFAPLFLEKDLFDKIALTLFEKYFRKICWKKKENSIFLALRNFLKIENKHFVFEKALSQLVALWIMHSFYDHEILSDESIIYDIYLWKSRHTIINNLTAWLKKLLIFMELGHNLVLVEGGKSKNMFFPCLVFLVNSGVLLNKKIWRNNKSNIFISCGLYLKKYNFYFKYKIFLEKPKLIFKKNIFYMGVHYSSIHLALHPNWRSKTKISLENADFLEKLCDLKYFIDWSMYKKIKDFLKTEWFDDNINTLEELFYQICLSKKHFWDKSTQRYSTRLYMYLTFWNLSSLKNLTSHGFYLSYFIDFRGRVYSNSIISPLGNRIFRYLYTYGTYTSNDLKNFRWDDHEKKKYISDSWRFTGLDKVYTNINTNDDTSIYYLYTAFFEIGKIFKNAYLEKYNGTISWKIFIEMGFFYFINFEKKKFGFEKNLDFLYTTNIIEKLNSCVFDKIIVYKDATASAIQLLMLVLGTHSEDRLKQCNLLDEFNWYDTYYFLIKEFKEKYNIKEEFSSKYLTRPLLKKTIMTYNYEATLWTCWNEYSNQLDYFDKEVKEVFKQFYTYLSQLFEEGGYYKIPSNTLIQMYKSCFMQNKTVEYVTIDGIKVNLDYYKVIQTRSEKKIDDKRESLVWGELSDDLDEVKIFRALRANLIHTLDGCIARAIIIKMPHPIITIHDSYGVDILNIELLVEIAKKEYNIIKNKNGILIQQGGLNYNVISNYIIL